MEQPNLSYIHSMSRGDKAFEEKIINIIKTEFPLEKEAYYNSYNTKNFKLTASIIHKLKHKISILGLEKSYKIATVFENNLLEGSIELKEEFEFVLNTITDYLKQL